MRYRPRGIRTALLALGLLTAAPAGAEEKFPSRPVTLIVPFAAGGRVDLHMRALGKQLEKQWSVPVLIDIKPGAAGTLGPATMAASAKPDGYTISEIPAGVYTVPLMQNVSYDPARDFTWIIHLSGYRYAVVVPASAPWQTWADLVADAKANPGKISYASTGTGSALHIGMESVAQAAGIKLLHLPTKGASEQITAMLGGHVAFIPTGGLAVPLVKSNQARALLSWTKERQPGFPDAPSLTEVGLSTELSLAFPYGIAGPKGMQPAVVKTLHDSIKEASETPEMRALLEQFEQDYLYLDSAAYAAFAAQQTEAYRVALGRLGLLKK